MLNKYEIAYHHHHIFLSCSFVLDYLPSPTFSPSISAGYSSFFFAFPSFVSSAISPAPLFFIPLNSPAVGVASGLVFCGGITNVYAFFMLWMVREAGFTAPAVMPRRLSLSRSAVKWSVGPLGEATPRTLLLKALS